MSDLFGLGSFGGAIGSSLISGAFGAYSDQKNRHSQQKINRENREFQNIWNMRQENFAREQFDYQKALNQQQMAREDTAYQRAATDMARAGLNPLSGIQGAQASAGQGSSQGFSADTSGGQAPQYTDVITPALSLGQQMFSMLSNGQFQAADIQNRKDALTLQEQNNAAQNEVAKYNAETARIQALTEQMKAGGDSPEVRDYYKALIKEQFDGIKDRSRLDSANANMAEHEYKLRSQTGTSSNSSEIGRIIADIYNIADKSPDMIPSAVKNITTALGQLGDEGKNLLQGWLEASGFGDISDFMKSNVEYVLDSFNPFSGARRIYDGGKSLYSKIRGK